MILRTIDRIAGAVALALALAACGSTPPVHLHTLLSPDPEPASTPTGPSVLLEAVTVPVAVDQPQWLVRMPDGTLALLENERWASAPSDELRAAIDDVLVRSGLVDARSPGAPPARWRVRVEVTRFETAAAGDARLAGVWAVSAGTRPAGGAAGVADGAAARCVFDLHEAAGPGTAALAQAHRRSVARVGAAVAAAVKAVSAGASASCP
jgi:uncharacterized lipoprotein YmbA